MKNTFLLLTFLFALKHLSANNKIDIQLKQAKDEIVEFFNDKNTTEIDKENFSKYLKYYKAEGQYQAVTPAPYELRDSLIQKAKDLFDELVNLAKDFEVERKLMPGSSKLSKEGEKFFEDLIEFTQSKVKEKVIVTLT